MRTPIAFLVFFCACSSEPSVPADVLPLEKMEAVFYDVVRADEMVDFLKLKDTTYQLFNRRTALYDSVFAIHGITKTEFKKSLAYYESRPDLLKPLFDDLQKKVTDTSSRQRPSERTRPGAESAL